LLSYHPVILCYWSLFSSWSTGFSSYACVWVPVRRAAARPASLWRAWRASSAPVLGLPVLSLWASFRAFLSLSASCLVRPGRARPGARQRARIDPGEWRPVPFLSSPTPRLFRSVLSLSHPWPGRSRVALAHQGCPAEPCEPRQRLMWRELRALADLTTELCP
jgi:hypothetical protein